MEFRILGPLEVIRAGRPVTLPRGRGRALLSLLVLRAGEVVSTDRIVDELWGASPPPTVHKGLQNLVVDLRRRLRSVGEVLATRPPGYVLRIEPEQVDATRFRRLLEQAVGAPPAVQADRLRAALELWRGPALADVAYEPFAQTEIAALEELRLTAIEDRVEADLALGRHGELVAEVEGLIAAHPYRERLRGALMLALYRSGRQADALAAYRDARRQLVEDLGLEPGPALSALEEAILRHDPSLDRTAPDGTGARMSATVPDAAGDESPTLTDAWLAAGRRTVTVVAVDLGSSPDRGSGGADPEVVQRLTGQWLDRARDIVDHHGGSIEGPVGGVIMARFGVPIAHEDDALRAVRAAMRLRETATSLSAELPADVAVRLHSRIGVATGEVVVAERGAGPAAASGEAVTGATMLQRLAAADEILVDTTTGELVGAAARLEPAGGRSPSGRADPDGPWRLVELLPPRPARDPAPHAPMVGRAAELNRLRAAAERVTRRGRAELVTVVGEAGVGKSRLALALAETLGSAAQVLVGRCPAYGERTTLWPLRQIVVQAAGDRDGIAALLGGHGAETLATEIAGAVGLVDAPEAGAGLFPAARRLFEAMAARQPLVVVFDDVHWAHATFVDLLDDLAASVAAPVLFLCLARPEYLETRPDPADHRTRDRTAGWSAAWPDAATLEVAPLDADDSRRLASLLARGRHGDDAVARIADLAQGNPLFIEQLLAALREGGEVVIPPSVEALLAARLDRLGPAERDLLRCASVVGVDFSTEAVTALVPEGARRFVTRHLQALEAKQLVHPAPERYLGRPSLTFRHVLIQVAAYRSITRRTRAELHERLADWLEAAPDTESDLEEVVGYHLEQACLHRRQLGLTADARTRALAVRAGERLASAGLRAFSRLDIAGAESLLNRARGLLPAGHPRRGEVLRRLGEAYPLMGRHRDADALLAELLEELGADPAPRLVSAARLERARVRLLMGPDPVPMTSIRDEAEEALRLAEDAGDDGAVVKAWFVLALVRRRAGAIVEMEAAARRGLAAAERAGLAREESGARWNVAWALAAGPTPVPDAIRECERLAPLRDTTHPGVLCELAHLRAMLGEFDHARELVARARRLMVERWRHTGPLMYPVAAAGRIGILAGDLDTAERDLRAAVDLAIQMDVREHVAQLAANLAQVLAAVGRLAEVERYATMSRSRAPAESVAAQALWRAATARLLLGRGQQPEADRLAREAVGLVPTDLATLRADLEVELAQTRLAGADHAGAMVALGEAVGHYERKGNRVGMERALALQARSGVEGTRAGERPRGGEPHRPPTSRPLRGP